jgi:hypothetical protein
VDDLRKFKRELEVLKDEKESQEKEALQKAANLRAELLVRNCMLQYIQPKMLKKNYNENRR